MRRQQLVNSLKHKKGQSLVELTLVLGILLTLLVGMVEFGNLLNQYVNLVDGAREGARFGSNDDPFATETGGGAHYANFFLQIYQIVQGRYDASGVQLTKGAISPIVLSQENGDDIVVTFFSVTGDARRATPLTNPCPTPPGTPAGTLQNLVRFSSNPPSRYKDPVTGLPNHTSRFSNAQVRGMLDGCAPNTGVLLVEVFYNYHQILKMGSFLKDANGNGVLDPILLHAYAIMPLSSAEPTPTP